MICSLRADTWVDPWRQLFAERSTHYPRFPSVSSVRHSACTSMSSYESGGSTSLSGATHLASNNDGTDQTLGRLMVSYAQRVRPRSYSPGSQGRVVIAISCD